MLAPLAATRNSGVELLALLLAELLHLMLCRRVAFRHLGERSTETAVALVRVVTQKASDAFEQCVSGALRFNTLGFQQASEQDVLLFETEDLSVGCVVCERFRFLKSLAFRCNELEGFLLDGLCQGAELLEGFLDL